MSAATSHDRGITVGKSWPRPTTPAPLVPRWEGEFRDHQDWVNFAHKRLTVASDSNGAQLKAICVDTLGRRCANGRDMKRAADEGTFPVRYFFDCEAAADVNADLLDALKDAIEALAMCQPRTDHGARCQSAATLKAWAVIDKAKGSAS